MTDDKNLRGAQDRSRVSGSEAYEVAYFARKHGLSMDKARDIIARHGPSREACDQAAEKLH